MQNNINIFSFLDTKLDETFPNQQFTISGYKMFRRDRSKYGGPIMIYINENIPCKTLMFKISSTTVKSLYQLKFGNGFALVSTSPLHKMESISLKIYYLLWLKCLANTKILCWLGISTLLSRTKILTFFRMHFIWMLN